MVGRARSTARVLLTAREVTRFSDSYWAAPAKLFGEIARLGFEPVLAGPWQVPGDVMSPLPALLVLTGGESVGENPLRDDFERELIQESISAQIPILGLCRGIQVLGSFFGSEVRRIEGHVACERAIVARGRGKGRVTCYHNDVLEEVPSGFNLFAESEDGCVEGIIHKCLPILGVQWHPEREEDSSPFSTAPILRTALSLV